MVLRTVVLMRLYVRQLSEFGPVHPLKTFWRKKGVRYREC